MRLAFWSKSMQNVVTVGKERWPSTKVLFCFRWDCVSAGAPLKTVPGLLLAGSVECTHFLSATYAFLELRDLLPCLCRTVNFLKRANSFRALLMSQAGP